MSQPMSHEFAASVSGARESIAKARALRFLDDTKEILTVATKPEVQHA